MWDLEKWKFMEMVRMRRDNDIIILKLTTNCKVYKHRKMFSDSLKVYQNECVAKCNELKGEVVHSCNTSLSMARCLIQYKTANTRTQCDKDRLVCAHDGQLYDSYCEAKSRGSVLGMCVVKTQKLTL